METKVDGLTQEEFVQRDVNKANYFIGRGTDAEGRKIRSPEAYMHATIVNAQNEWDKACAS